VIEAVSAGKALMVAGEGPAKARSLLHGDVATVRAMARQSGLPALLGPARRERDPALARVISRAARSASKVTTCALRADTMRRVGLDTGASSDQVYAAMDRWLARGSAGNVGDPAAFVQAVEVVRQVQAHGDGRDGGTIATARIATLRQRSGKGWLLTALRAPAVAKLAADTRPLQLSSFGQADLAEFAHHDCPNARLAACRNPALAVERTANARPLFRLPKASRPSVTVSVLTGCPQDRPQAGQVVNRQKVAEQFAITITDTTTSRNRPGIGTGAGPDGTCVIHHRARQRPGHRHRRDRLQEPGLPSTRPPGRQGRYYLQFDHGGGRAHPAMKGRAR